MPDERTVLRSVSRTFLSASDQGGYADDDSGMSASGSLTANRFHPEGQRRLVMLVDDDPAMGAMYGAGLLAAGFRVIVLSDVSAIFLTLEKQIPDVAVLDFQLGGILTGVDVLENLRLDSRTTHVAALILSNHLGDRDGQTDRAFAAGAFAWLVKNRTIRPSSGSSFRKRLDHSLATPAMRRSPGPQTNPASYKARRVGARNVFIESLAASRAGLQIRDLPDVPAGLLRPQHLPADGCLPEGRVGFKIGRARISTRGLTAQNLRGRVLYLGWKLLVFFTRTSAHGNHFSLRP